MEPLHSIVQIGVYVLMAVTVLAAIGAVTLPNIFHAALSLMVALVGTAGIYISLHAEFLAVVQILLYVGAVMTLVVFSIMMTQGFSDKKVPQQNHLSIPAFTSLIIFWVLLVGIFRKTPWPEHPAPAMPVTVADLGKSLLTHYAFPFEVISVFLIAAMIGAIIIAKKCSPEESAEASNSVSPRILGVLPGHSVLEKSENSSEGGDTP